jgi:hypothetical protein
LLLAALMMAATSCRSGDVDGPTFTPKPLNRAQRARLEAAPLGSAENPVRCDRPDGERAYLQRLRCAGGEAPTFARVGSTGAGPYGTVLDVYSLRCPGAPAPVSVFMDMYHEGFVEQRALPGFSIAAAPEDGPRK